MLKVISQSQVVQLEKLDLAIRKIVYNGMLKIPKFMPYKTPTQFVRNLIAQMETCNLAIIDVVQMLTMNFVEFQDNFVRYVNGDQEPLDLLSLLEIIRKCTSEKHVILSQFFNQTQFRVPLNDILFFWLHSENRIKVKYISELLSIIVQCQLPYQCGPHILVSFILESDFFGSDCMYLNDILMNFFKLSGMIDEQTEVMNRLLIDLYSLSRQRLAKAQQILLSKCVISYLQMIEKQQLFVADQYLLQQLFTLSLRNDMFSVQEYFIYLSTEPETLFQNFIAHCKQNTPIFFGEEEPDQKLNSGQLGTLLCFIDVLKDSEVLKQGVMEIWNMVKMQKDIQLLFQ
uniref:Uncharacterized protein n=1 Tax=Trepomonas sp. PC1 TaxID=1076344 RepID=A0A146K0N7_9EUKA|eukprot:JAP90317.1 Hypothetical protein TPC1_30188 [Trepomonas sp. PC1]